MKTLGDVWNNASELVKAEALAGLYHQNQWERYTPEPSAYINHLRRVVGLLETDTEKAIGWLHDVVEDSELTADGLVMAGISQAVANAVHILTRYDRQEPYDAYIRRVLASGNVYALAVKRADLLDHLRAETRASLPPHKRAQYEAALAALTG